MNLIRRLARKRMEKRVERSWNTFRFPEALADPASVTVFCGPDVASTWPGIYLSCSLQKHYRNAAHHMIIQETMTDLAAALPWEPSVHTWSSSPGQLSAPIPEGTLLFSASRDVPGLAEVVLAGSPILSIAPAGSDSANVNVRINSERYPDMVYGMCETLGIPPDRNWRPSVPVRLAEAASAILSPVSHRTLPYILASSQVADILERRRAELPLRLVIADGKGSDIPPDTAQGIIMAIVSGASAVVTARDDLWVHANAMGVPVVGYDRRDAFQPWGNKPSQGETGLMEEWSGLLRKGW